MRTPSLRRKPRLPHRRCPRPPHAGRLRYHNPVPPQPVRDPILLVHGGAWAIPADAAEAHEAGVRRALEAGYAILSRGGSALDAVRPPSPSLKMTPHSTPAAAAFSPPTAASSSTRSSWTAAA